VLQDLASARDWYQKAADQGNAPARYNLGNMYLTGRGVDKDAAKGLALVEASAKQGFPLAQSRMAGLYYTGEAVAQDKVKAYAWALLAAGDGDPDGQDLMKTMDGNHLLNEADMRQASVLANTYASAQ
jgi:TPR repeat protein